MTTNSPWYELAAHRLTTDITF